MNKDSNVISIYNQFKDWTKGKKINAGSIIVLTTRLMTLVQQKIKEHKQGKYKKNIVITVLKLLVRDSNELTEDEKEEVNFLIDCTIPTMIDMMILIAKNEIDLDKTKKNINNCFKKCH